MPVCLKSQKPCLNTLSRAQSWEACKTGALERLMEKLRNLFMNDVVLKLLQSIADSANKGFAGSCRGM